MQEIYVRGIFVFLISLNAVLHAEDNSLLGDIRFQIGNENYVTASDLCKKAHLEALSEQGEICEVDYSFVMGYWNEIAEHDPKHQKSYNDAISDLENRIKNNPNSKLMLYYGYIEHCERNSLDKSIVSLFKNTSEKQPDVAAKIFQIVFERLLIHKEYELCSKYIDPLNNIKSYVEAYRWNLTQTQRTEGLRATWEADCMWYLNVRASRVFAAAFHAKNKDDLKVDEALAYLKQNVPEITKWDIVDRAVTTGDFTLSKLPLDIHLGKTDRFK